MKILVINPGTLPSPALYGGAVETIIDQYTINQSIDFVIYSQVDNCSFNNYKKKNVEYRYIYKEKKKGFKFYTFKILNKIFKNYYFGDVYTSSIIKDLKRRKEKECYDYIIIENIPKFVLPFHIFFKKNIVLHQHNNYLNKKSRLNTSIIKKCSKIITVSNFVKNNIKKNYEKNEITTVYNGVDQEFTKVSNKEITSLKKQLGLNESLVFGYVGRLVKEKGVKEILYAFKEIHKKYPNTKLLMVGSQGFASNKKTDFIDECKKIISELDDAVIFSGFIEQKKLHKYYSIIDVQLVPSIIDDACPMSVLEGMAVGCAQIVTDSGGIPEEVSTDSAIIISRNKLIDNLISKMEILINDEKYRKKLVNNSIKRSKFFTKEIFVKNFLETIVKGGTR